MDLERFPATHEISDNTTPRIISIGRLVAFKGFEYLIDACAELAQRGLEFTCEIIGDGPLRGDLESRIKKLNLSNRVHLLGSLSQGAVLEKLGSADIFALASVVDSQGASDVFPTVIIEAMAAARPVVSTCVAGIPESVVHGETGLLAPPADTMALAEALSRLIKDGKLRQDYGRAGRVRVEQHFRIEQTVAPLIELLQKSPGASSESPKGRIATVSGGATTHKAAGEETSAAIAYVIDRWPDKDLPLLERELEEMKRRDLAIIPIACELDATAYLSQKMEKLGLELEFLPDPMVIEAEWRANPALAQKLEEQRAREEPRAPSRIFLREARFALAMRKLLLAKKVSHVHATSSRALVCALILQDIANITVSATIEARPELPHNWIASALRKCEGGRLSDRKLLRQLGDSFLFDKAGRHAVRMPQGFWQKWSGLLRGWSTVHRNSKIGNQK
jgi:hypothetical protein